MPKAGAQPKKYPQFYADESIRAINLEDLRQMILAMRYQNGLEIDTDNMTY
jgi:hypothetical protein